MRALRNIAIIAALAFFVAAVPGGGNVAEAVLTLLTMAFLATIAFAVYFAWRQNQLTFLSLSDRQRGVLAGAVGLAALMIAGADELLETGGGTLVWICCIGLAVFAAVSVWTQATRS